MNETSEVKVEPKLQIEPLATPYRAFIPVTEGEIKEKMDAHWNIQKDSLIKGLHYKGKKEKGGKFNEFKARKHIEGRLGTSKIYAPVFADVGRDKVEEETGEKLMLVNEAAYFNETDPTIQMHFYFYPKITVEGEVDFKLNKIELKTFEEEFEGRLQDLKWRNRVRTTTDEITNDTEVVVDVAASKNGKVYPQEKLHLFRKEIKHFPLPDVGQCMIGHKNGDAFEMDCIKDEDEFKYHIKIHEAYTLSTLEDSDPELYKDEKANNLEEFKQMAEEEYAKVTEDKTNEYIYLQIINKIIDKSKMEAIPQRFIDITLDNFIKQNGQDTPQARQYFSHQILNDIVQQMAKDYYVKEYGLEDGIDFDGFVEDMKKRVEWID